MPDIIEYHYGFYGAMRAQYENKNILLYQELELGGEPVRLDMLLIRKTTDEILGDDIGSFFRTYNIIEYKSPQDGLTADDFYKAQGYALIYKSLGKTVDEIPIDKMTVTVFRHTFPRELFDSLKRYGINITEYRSGIYRLDGLISVPAQVIVTSRLPGGEYPFFKVLAKGADKADVIAVLKEAMNPENKAMFEYIHSILKVSQAANAELFMEIKEEGVMTEALQTLFRDEIKTEKENAKAEIAEEMLKDSEPIDKIIKYTKLSAETIMSIAKKIGIKNLFL